MKRYFLLALALIICSSFLFLGCGSQKYIKPMDFTGLDSEKQKYLQIVDYGIEDVWKATVDYVSSAFFVIDNMEKDSYFMNLAYSTDNPAEYINCGTVQKTTVGQDYIFAAAIGHVRYMTMSGVILLHATRTMKLNGKINILLSHQGPEKTQIRVTVRYVASERIDYVDSYSNPRGTYTDTFSLNTGGCKQASGDGYICCPKHQIEESIITGIKNRLAASSH